MDQFTDIRSSGKIAMKLEENQALIGVALCNNNDDILLSTYNGKCIRFPVDKLRVFQSRNSTGVKGINLENNNKVIALSILKHINQEIETREQYLKIDVETRLQLQEALIFNQQLAQNRSDLLQSPKPLPQISNSELNLETIHKMAINEQFILTITENGFGKRTSAYEYRITNRGGMGITNIITSKRNGNVVASFAVEGKDQIMLITNKGTLIRTSIASVRIVGRNSQGVTLIKTQDENVVAVARIATNEESDDSSESTEEQNLAIETS